MSNLQGRYVVSGAAGDIGAAACAAINAAGGIACGSDIVRSDHVQIVDVCDEAAVEAWLDGIDDLRGAVVNAATVHASSVRDISIDDWQQEIAVNLSGAFILARAAANRLAANGGGEIVIVGSWAAARPHPHIPAYSAAKAGLRMLMQCMAMEYAADQVRINEIAPGFVDAGLSAQLFKRDQGLREAAQARVPLDALMTAEEVAVEIVALLDPTRRHLTGSTVTMDGGLSLKVS